MVTASDALPLKARMFNVVAEAPTCTEPYNSAWYTVPIAPGVAVTTGVAVVLVRFNVEPLEPVYVVLVGSLTSIDPQASMRVGALVAPCIAKPSRATAVA